MPVIAAACRLPGAKVKPTAPPHLPMGMVAIRNAAETWSGRGRQPLWFAKALKKSGGSAESLLIGGAVTKKAAPAKKKAPVKKAKKAPVKKA